MPTSFLRKKFRIASDWMYFRRIKSHATDWREVSGFFPYKSPFKLRMAFFFQKHDNQVTQIQLDQFLEALEEKFMKGNSTVAGQSRAKFLFSRMMKDGTIVQNSDGTFGLSSTVPNQYVLIKLRDADLKYLLPVIGVAGTYWGIVLNDYLLMVFCGLATLASLILVVDEYVRTSPF